MTPTSLMSDAYRRYSSRSSAFNGGGRIVTLSRQSRADPGLLLLPGTLWMLVFVGVSLASIVVFSFWTSGFTGLVPEYTLANYATC